MLVNSSLCMGRALSYTDYKTTTGFPTLVAPVHAFGFAPGIYGSGDATCIEYVDISDSSSAIRFAVNGESDWL